MNYYIEGNPEKAEQIKAAFKKLGYDISWPGGCANPDVINIGVERNGAKYVVAETSEYIKDIIKTHPDYKELELPKPHYDISNFKPFDRVLVRQDDSCTWGASFFGRYAGMFMCCNNACFIQCIPFNDDTKHLLGTTDPCDEQYINW